MVIVYREIDSLAPARRGLLHTRERACVLCSDLTAEHTRAYGPSDDQTSPCPCCGRGPAQSATRPTCAHESWWDVSHEFGFEA